jgi:thiamine monophosphate kinase
VNLSDIASKGGMPVGLVMALGLPRETDEKFLLELAKGMNDCATAYSTQIIGGDTKENSNLTITGTALGLVKKSGFMPRFGAKGGDLIAVTGRLARGRRWPLLIEIESWNKNRRKSNAGTAAARRRRDRACKIRRGHFLHGQFRRPCNLALPDDKIGLRDRDFKNSDRPGSDGGRAAYRQERARSGALLRRDYELVCTLKPELAQKAVRGIEKAGGRLTIIGKICGRRKILIDEKCKKTPLENRGYEHFL